MAAEAEVDWERNSNLAAEQTLDVFFVVVPRCGRRGRGNGRRREEVAEEQREGEVVFLVQERHFSEGFGETAIGGADDEAVFICQLGGGTGMRGKKKERLWRGWTYTLAAILRWVCGVVEGNADGIQGLC